MGKGVAAVVALWIFAVALNFAFWGGLAWFIWSVVLGK